MQQGGLLVILHNEFAGSDPDNMAASLTAAAAGGALDAAAPVTERMLGGLAHRFYPQHLYRFATLQVGIQDAKFYQIEYDAGPRAWNRVFGVRSIAPNRRRITHTHVSQARVFTGPVTPQVLRVWREKEEPTVQHLQRLLEEAERLGFVQEGTCGDFTRGKTLDLNYLEKCEFSSCWHRKWPATFLCRVGVASPSGRNAWRIAPERNETGFEIHPLSFRALSLAAELFTER